LARVIVVAAVPVGIGLVVTLAIIIPYVSSYAQPSMAFVSGPGTLWVHVKAEGAYFVNVFGTRIVMLDPVGYVMVGIKENTRFLLVSLAIVVAGVTVKEE
jgi:hypothetical protein